MKYLFFDLDETLYVANSRVEILTEAQKRQLNLNKFVIISGIIMHPLYHKLHHMVFKHLNAHKEQFKVAILTASKLEKNQARNQLNQLFDTQLFNSDREDIFSNIPEHRETVPWFDKDYLPKLGKEEKINYHLATSFNALAEEVDCYLIDDNPKHLAGAQKYNIKTIDSSAQDYYTQLTKLVFGEAIEFTESAW